MGTDPAPAPGGRGAAAPATGSFQLEDFVAGWIGGEPTPDGREPPQRWVCFRETPVPERQRERGGWALRPVYTRGSGQGALHPCFLLAPHAACCGESPVPGGLAVTCVNSASLTEVHLSCRFASNLGSPELDPVMIKPSVQGDSQWSAPACTHPSVTGCPPEFGEVACRDL